MLIALWATLSWAGYGDPVAGHPNWDERSLFFWGNAARVAPGAYRADYTAGGCDFGRFEADEQAPKPPLLWNHALGEAARAHNDDMINNDFFDHDSSDGTPFQDRVWRYYDGTRVGENIAWGYVDSRTAVLEGWMCSPGHRANLMYPGFDEIGVAARSATYTQDFGYRAVGTRPATAALHEPASPRGTVTFRVVAWATPPARVVAVLDGVEVPLALESGEAARGVYQGQTSVSGGCHTWYAEVTGADGERSRFPEDGAYGWGPCTWDDAGSMWQNRQTEPEVEDTDVTDSDSADTDEPDTGDSTGDSDNNPDPTDLPETTCSGCNSTTSTAWLLAWVAAVAIRRRA